MPELPETETIARDLNEAIAGRTIVDVKVTRADVLREAATTAFVRQLIGARILKSWRRAKLVVTDLSTGDRLVVQPRFTGALIVETADLDRSLLAYSTMRLELDDARALHYCDVRRLGTVASESWRLMNTPGMGKEPLTRAPRAIIGRSSGSSTGKRC